jgi:hypothetical protein
MKIKQSRPTVSFTAWCLSAASALLVGLTTVNAETRTTAPKIPGPTRSIAPFNAGELVHIRAGGGEFWVPSAYLEFVPTREHIALGLVSPRGFSFVFWYPDRGPSSTKTIPSLIHPRPREEGRPAPTDEQFRVGVVGLQIVQSGDANYILPQQRMANVELLSPEGRRAVEEIPGLDCVRRAQGKELKGRSDCSYMNSPGDELTTIFTCISDPEKTANPLCFGWAYFKSERMGFYYKFAAPKRRHWREIAYAARALALSWTDQR